MNTITILDGQRSTCHVFLAPRNLGELLSECGAHLPMPCGCRGTCGKCRVGVEGLGMVLACQTVLHDDAIVTLPGQGEARILTDGDMRKLDPDPWAEGLGVAIDIGTTTVAAYLYGLKTGEALGRASAPNPQSPYGADVITRMQKAEEGALGALRQSIVDCVKGLICSLCAPQSLGALVLTGNTAMLYLLVGIMPSPIMRVPFALTQPFGIQLAPEPFGLPASGSVYLPRCISAYVGADVTCALLAANLYVHGQPGAGGPTLLADIGTNGELVLLANGELYACSTAAGPAFEGAGISQGMTARDGAISHVRFRGGQFEIEVIGDGPALGLCGSGIVDALAALLDAGALDETGALEGGVFTLPGTSVSITQADVRAVQLAKSALCAGMLTLIEQAGLSPQDVKTLLIAGGFGSYIDPIAAQRIGLIPEGFAAKARAIGNAAGMGACMVLLSLGALRDAEAASHAASTVELAANPCFMDHYVENMLFPET